MKFDTYLKYVAPLGMVMTLLVFFVLIIGKGLTDTKASFGIALFAGAFIIGIIMMGVISYIYNKTRGIDYEAWRKLMFIHEPDQSLIGNVIKNPLTLFSALMIILIPALYFTSIKQIFFAGIPMKAQQINELGNILYNSIFPLAENMMATFVIGIMLIILYKFTTARTNNKAVKVIYWAIALTIIPYLFASVFWTNYHNLVYANDSVARSFTLIFGFLGAFMTILTASFIPWAVFHFANNLFASASNMGLLGNPFFILAIVGLEIGMIALFIYSLRSK